MKTFIPGDVIYFKQARRTTSKNSEGFSTGQGMAFGLLLGVVPQGVPDPCPEQIFRICAGFGMVTVDSIIELMGEEFAHLYIARLQARYSEAPEKPKAPSGLVSSDGKPLVTKPTLVM